MSEKSGRHTLPPEITEIVDRVLDASGLDFVDGRAEVEQELFSHFEDRLAAGSPVDQLIERFGDPVAAGRRIARTRPKAAARNRGEHGRWWMSPMELWDEVRRAARRLGRAPGFAAIVILTLGLGVGANTAIFTVLNAVLLEELPYAEPEQLVRVYENNEENPQLQFIRAPVIAEWIGKKALARVRRPRLLRPPPSWPCSPMIYGPRSTMEPPTSSDERSSSTGPRSRS